MAEKFDAVILGMGPGGEVLAGQLLGAGRKVAVVERELIGGECAYWACIPSKTLLRPPEARNEAGRTFGSGRPDLDLREVFDYRDGMIRHLDDSAQVESYEGKGATVVKGAGRITGPGTVEVGGRELEADHTVIATGSSSKALPIEGLEDVPYWTNREATTTREVPGRTVVIGGGPNGMETAQWLSRLGSRVTIVEHSGRLIDREDPRVGELIQPMLEEEGIEVRLGQRVETARREGGATVLGLGDGSEVETDVLVLAAGRTPRTWDIGLESLGIEAGGAPIPVDERCRVEGAPSGVWAVGDVTGIMPFTHVAQYQGKVVASNILGEQRRGPERANYHGIPRVVFSDPEVAATGLTADGAREAGIDVATVDLDLTKALARPWTFEEDPRGHLGLVADRERGVLVGAWAVAPRAGEWIHQACGAVREEVPVERLLDTVAQFPTFSQAYLEALEGLDL